MKLVLAPIADYTDSPFRRMCFDGGADAAFTEMVSAAALRHGHAATRFLLEKDESEGEVSCQIFGADETDVAHAARIVSEEGRGFAAIDLNAGCPMRRITQGGAGAALVPRPEKVFRLLSAMKENTPLPVTLKTRLGPHPGSTTIFELVDAAEKAGVSRIAIHARYTSEMHGGRTHLDILSEAVERACVPVVGNGGVTNAKSAAEMAKTGVSGIMIARAAMANPWVFSEIKAALAGVPPPARPGPMELFERHLKLVLEFRERLAAKFPDARVPSPDGYASIKMHTQLFRYFNGLPGAAALRGRLSSIRTIADIKKCLSDFPASFSKPLPKSVVLWYNTHI